MGEIKITFGDVSKNQFISSDDMQVGLNREKFNGKIQLSIFDLFDCKNVNGEIDTAEEKDNIFKDLQLAAGADGNVTNLSEEEALTFLKEHNIEGATAQDLFDFFNIALDRSTEQKSEEQKVQEEVVQEPPAEVTTEQEAPAPQVKEEKDNYWANSSNPDIGSLNQNQQNAFFKQSLVYQNEANKSESDGAKLGYTGLALSYEGKGKSYSLHETQKLIEPQGENSLSVGAYTQFSKEGMFTGVSGAGQIGIGDNNSLSGAASYTAETGEDPSSMTNVQITDRQHFGFGGNLSVTGNYQNYKDGEMNITKEGVSVSGSVPIPGNDGGILLGGSAYVTGQVTHSESNAVDDSNMQSSSTFYKGTVGASYSFGFGKDMEQAYEENKEILDTGLPHVTIGAQISAAGMSDIEGMLWGGGVGGPGIPAYSFGSIPTEGGFRFSTGASLNDIPIVGNDENSKFHSDKITVTGDISYGASNLFKFGENTEQYLNAGINTHINSINADVGGQYTLQHVAYQSPVYDVGGYYSQGFNVGNNMQVKVTAEGGWNSEFGAYGGVGVVASVGNPSKK